MAKNTISTPIKDGVMADNSTLSSNEIKKRIDTAAASVLPEVSGSDEGKVLSVNEEGEWEAAEVSTDGGSVVINATSSNSDDITFEEGVFDKLSDAFTNNKLVFVKVGGTMSYSNADIIIPVAFSSISALPYFIAFEGGIVTKKNSDMYGLYISASGAPSSVNGNVDFRKIS